MRIVILGAGAVGGAIAGYLARAERDVVLLARGAQLAAVRAHGLRVESPGSTFVVRPTVASSGDAFAWRAGDVVLVAVKTQDVAAALRDLAPPADVPLVCLTNGVEAERIALRQARHVHGAYVWMPATYLVPGVVQVWASPVPGAIDVGRYPEGGDARTVDLAAELGRAGFSSEPRADIMRWKRGKLLWNLANGAEALCGRAVRTSELADRARREAVACFVAAGLAFTGEAEEAARSAGYHPRPIGGVHRAGGSTWQSLARGASTLETDYLNGEIVLLGRLHGVATPVNELLQRIAADAARAGAKPGSMPLAELLARVPPA